MITENECANMATDNISTLRLTVGEITATMNGNISKECGKIYTWVGDTTEILRKFSLVSVQFYPNSCITFYY